MWRLNSQWITENQRGNKKYLETNDNENTITQILWDAAKAVLRVKFTAIQPQETNKQKKPQTT